MDDNTVTLFTVAGILLGSALSLWIFYEIIKAAVKAGTAEMNELLRRQIRIEKHRLQKEGLNNAEISTVITKDQ